jgi:fructokinase
VLSMLAKLGHKGAFIGKIGADMFGDQLACAIREVGIDTTGLKIDEQVHTTLAFVHTLEGGEREFSFYRNPGADMMLSEHDLDETLIKDSKFFHFGSLSMTDEVCRQATRKAIEIAEQSGALLSYDPNLREPLWKSLEDAKEQIFYGMEHCNVLKISDNEIQWLTGKEDYDAGILLLMERYHIPLILLSMGKNGSRAYTNRFRVEKPAFVTEDTIETTGAGDVFCACILHYILEHGWHEYNEKELGEMLEFANAAASIITTRKGALRVMPKLEEILHVQRGE